MKLTDIIYKNIHFNDTYNYRIIKSLERYAENADIGNEGRMRMVSDNVVMEIWDLTPSMQPVIGLAAESVEPDNQSAFKTETIATVYNRSQTVFG